jgi:hypothetical protein
MAVECMKRTAVYYLTTLIVVMHFGTTCSRAVEQVGGQELAVTMGRIKGDVEALSVTLIPTDIEGGNQSYSGYTFNYNGCLVTFSYDFTFFDRLTRRRKTVRFPFSFDLRESDSPDLVPFYLTHISNQVYSVEAKGFRIPVADADQGERIARELDRARRLCAGGHGGGGSD